MSPETQTPTNQEPLPAGQCGSLSVIAGSAIWQPANTAPKGPLIVADFGWPWPVLATWCERSNSWAAVSVQRESDGRGVAVDAWFETEYESAEDMRRWQPWPSLPNIADLPTRDERATNPSK